MAPAPSGRPPERGVDTLDAIFRRRSIGRLVEPAPSEDDLRLILSAAAAAPDHGALRPFRFVVLRGSGRDAFGHVLEDAYRSRAAVPDEEKAAKERTKLGRAPVVVVVGAVHEPSTKVPWLEQQAAAAAACQNALLAATALGYGSMWRTGDPAYDSAVLSALGVDAVVGFLYLGTVADGQAKAVKAPSLDGLVTEWHP